MVRQLPTSDIGKNALKNHNSYFAWLCDQSGLHNPLSRIFYETEFRWSKEIPDDANRAKAGMELREAYAQHLLIGEDGVISPADRKNIDRLMKSIIGPASVFEVLVSIARTLDEMLNLEEKPRPEVYFGRLMENLGLDIYDDEDYDLRPEQTRKAVQEALDKWMDRAFLPDGEGGLFPLDTTEKSYPDQRKVSIWEQMGTWVEQEFEY